MGIIKSVKADAIASTDPATPFISPVADFITVIAEVIARSATLRAIPPCFRVSVSSLANSRIGTYSMASANAIAIIEPATPDILSDLMAFNAAVTPPSATISATTVNPP